MKKIQLKLTSLLIAVAMLTTAVPLTVQAQSVIQFQPRTTQELIAYLYGRIVQLQEIQKMIQGSGPQAPSQSLFDYVVVETQKADDITDTTAYLRGETLLFGDAKAYVWFEYGQDEDFLDFKTTWSYVDSAYDRAIRTQVRNLEEDERYYFRLVAEDDNDVITYGSIFSFRTDEEE